MTDNGKQTDRQKTPDHKPLEPGLGQMIGVAGGLPAVEPPSITQILARLPEAPETQLPPDLEKRLRSPRTMFSAILSVVTGLMAEAVVHLAEVVEVEHDQAEPVALADRARQPFLPFLDLLLGRDPTTQRSRPPLPAAAQGRLPLL